MQTVRTKIMCTTASGNAQSWFMLVKAVDTTKKDGYAFEGEFLPLRKEIDLQVGAIVIEKEPTGSVKNREYIGNVYRVVTESIEDVRNAHLEYLEEFKWRGDFLSFRDYVAELLQPIEPAAEPSPSPSNTTTAAELIAMLAKLPPDTLIFNTADHINGAWSHFELEPIKIALDGNNEGEFNPHKVIYDDYDESALAEYLEENPSAVIVDGYHI
jgi:hypothetical protein